MVKRAKAKGAAADGDTSSDSGDDLVVRLQHKQPMKATAHARSDLANGRSEEELQQLMQMDPKKAKRILANRQSAAKSKERKQQLVQELETRLSAVQDESQRLERLHSALALDLTTLTQFNTSLAEEVDELLVRVQHLQTSHAVMAREMMHARRILSLPLDPLPDPPASVPLEPRALPALSFSSHGVPPEQVAAPQAVQALKNPLIPPKEMAALAGSGSNSGGAPVAPSIDRRSLGALSAGLGKHSSSYDEVQGGEGYVMGALGPHGQVLVKGEGAGSGARLPSHLRLQQVEQQQHQATPGSHGVLMQGAVGVPPPYLGRISAPASQLQAGGAQQQSAYVQQQQAYGVRPQQQLDPYATQALTMHQRGSLDHYQRQQHHDGGSMLMTVAQQQQAQHHFAVQQHQHQQQYDGGMVAYTGHQQPEQQHQQQFYTAVPVNHQAFGGPAGVAVGVHQGWGA